MTAHIRSELHTVIGEILAQGPPEEFIGRLCEAGIIDYRAVEGLAIRRYIRNHIRQGARTSDAITWAADHFCCSYEKARNIYYQKTNKHL
ncbi:MAG: hypothetical protein II345_03605 [Alistipes sp.]|nr:hypothetical protein [Alistipes sp.]